MTPPVHEPCENKGSRPAKKDVQRRKIQSACRFRGISDVDRGSTQATAAMKQNALMAALVYIWRSKAEFTPTRDGFLLRYVPPPALRTLFRSRARKWDLE